MIKEVGQISQYMNDYGPFIVILSVFLLIFLILITFLLQSHKRTIGESQELNKQIVTSILNDYFSKNSTNISNNEKPYNERNIVDIFVKLNKSLKAACEDTLEKLNSNRTAIYVFHNGSHASHGLPFFKMSCISEWVSKNSNANIKMSEHSAMPLSLFDSIVSNLYKKSEYSINITTTDPGEKLFLQNMRVKECFLLSIYDDDNNIMGFIFNGYNDISEERTMDTERETLTNLANTARPVIEFSNYQEQDSSRRE